MARSGRRPPIDLELRIEKLVYGGAGLARRPEGKVVFVDGGLPGDRVVARLGRGRRDYDRAWVVERLEEGEPRRVPPCPVFDECGGCIFQDVSYGRSLELKQAMVVEVFERAGGFVGVDVRPPLASPMPFGYRRRAQIKAVLRQGTRRLGFYRRGTRRVVDMESCNILYPPVERARRAMQDLLDQLPLTGKELTHVKINATAGAPGLQVVLSGNRVAPDLDDLWREAHKRLPTLRGLIWESRGPRVWGDPTLEERVPRQPGGPLRFQISYQSFFQVNAFMDGPLFDEVARAVSPRPGELVFDLYSGVGTFAHRLVREGARVVAVESNPHAVDDARRSARWNGIDPEACEHVAADTARGLARLMARTQRPGIVFLDPSRAGAGPVVCEQLIELAPRRIVYLSCNAATLVRDLTVLCRAYEMTRVQPIDLFPQTAHVEVLVELERRRAAG